MQDLETHFIDDKTDFPIGIVQLLAGISYKLDYFLHRIVLLVFT